MTDNMEDNEEEARKGAEAHQDKWEVAMAGNRRYRSGKGKGRLAGGHAGQGGGWDRAVDNRWEGRQARTPNTQLGGEAEIGETGDGTRRNHRNNREQNGTNSRKYRQEGVENSN